MRLSGVAAGYLPLLHVVEELHPVVGDLPLAGDLEDACCGGAGQWLQTSGIYLKKKM